MTWMMDEGFKEVFDQFQGLEDWPHQDRLQWQQRYLIGLLKA
jgi:hypothetical protein